MAKKVIIKRPLHDVSRKISTPSPYGSHKSMVVDHNEFKINLNEGQVLCKDDDEYYITNSDRLDNGLADPNRYSSKKLSLSKGDTNE